MLHACAAMWKGQGVLTAKGSPIKHHLEILNLLDAILLPKEVAVMQRRGHQRGDASVAEGGSFADAAAKATASLKPQHG